MSPGLIREHGHVRKHTGVDVKTSDAKWRVALADGGGARMCVPLLR
jgi:hypothetical protein